MLLICLWLTYFPLVNADAECSINSQNLLALLCLLCPATITLYGAFMYYYIPRFMEIRYVVFGNDVIWWNLINCGIQLFLLASADLIFDCVPHRSLYTQTKPLFVVWLMEFFHLRKYPYYGLPNVHIIKIFDDESPATAA